MEPQRLAWRKFLTAHACVLAALEEKLEEQTRLPLSWYDILAQLSTAAHCGLRLQDLARSVVISKSGLTRRLDRMEAAGLVERRECSEDKRGSYAVLTSAGREAFEAARPIHLADVQEHFLRYLTEEEAVVMVRALDRVLGGVGQCADVPQNIPVERSASA